MAFLLQEVVTTDSAALQDFATTFFGYGTWSAPFWFVGMEEGGQACPDHLKQCVNAWLAEGRPEIVDLARYQRRIGGEKWFDEPAKSQSTWRRLIRAVLVATGIKPTRETLLYYQRTRLGREDGETALLELLPFPSPRTRDWPYEELEIPEYRDRDSYRRALEPFRRTRIAQLIAQHQPRAVVFYGQPSYWREYFPDETIGSTRVIIRPHPIARGTKRDHWDHIGRLMALPPPTETFDTEHPA